MWAERGARTEMGVIAVVTMDGCNVLDTKLAAVGITLDHTKDGGDAGGHGNFKCAGC